MSSPMERRDPLLWILVVLLVLVLVPGIFMMGFWGSGMMGGAGPGGFMGGWIGMGLGVVVLVVLVVILLWASWAGRTATPLYPSVGPFPPSDALAILDARYARGEISRDEYLRMRADLERRNP